MSAQTHEMYMTDGDFGEGAALHRLVSKQASRNFKQSSKWLHVTFLIFRNDMAGAPAIMVNYTVKNKWNTTNKKGVNAGGGEIKSVSRRGEFWA